MSHNTGNRQHVPNDPDNIAVSSSPLIMDHPPESNNNCCGSGGTYTNDGNPTAAVAVDDDDDDDVATWLQYFSSCRFVELVICVIPLILGSVLEFLFQPNQRPIPYQYLESTGDYILNQEYNQIDDGETVPTVVLAVVFSFLPCIVQLLLAWFVPYNTAATKRQKWDVIHKTLCVFPAAFGTTMVLTNFVKLYVGYLRPIFYDGCQPNDTYDECQNPDGDRPVRLSFPSGHASLSVCGMLLISHYLEQRFGVYRHCYHRGNKGLHRTETAELGENYVRATSTTMTSTDFRLQRIVSLLCYLPMVGALFVGTYVTWCASHLSFTWEENYHSVDTLTWTRY
jgi:PAP2 superfamily